MPTRPPYPREARIVTVEKAMAIKPSPGISCVPITPNQTL